MNSRVAIVRIDILITDCGCFVFNERLIDVEQSNARLGGSLMSLWASIDTISITLVINRVDWSELARTFIHRLTSTELSTKDSTHYRYKSSA